MMSKGLQIREGACGSHLPSKTNKGKAHGKTRRVYIGFMDLEKAYDRVNREDLCQVLRMYEVGGKLLNGIKNMYANNLTCVRVKGGKSECFRINMGVRQGCIMSPWLFNLYLNGMMKEVKMGVGVE